MQSYYYPQYYANETAYWIVFNCAPYSVINENRTRDAIAANSVLEIALPITSEPKMTLAHQFAEGTNPVGPVLSMAGLQNTSSPDKDGSFIERLTAPIAAFYEATFTTDTFRRFSNVTELTMTSEARRNYLFKYTLVPKTSAEAATINSIVSSFRNFSYPSIVPNLPERTFPQYIWTIDVTAEGDTGTPLNSIWLGDPLPCVLSSITVEKGDPNDPVLKVMPDGQSLITNLTLSFVEFETGTFAPQQNKLFSKSEVSAYGDLLS